MQDLLTCPQQFTLVRLALVAEEDFRPLIRMGLTVSSDPVSPIPLIRLSADS